MRRRKYKGYIIEKETDPWALNFGLIVRFFKDGDEKIEGAKSLTEAKEIIDERKNKPSST